MKDITSGNIMIEMPVINVIPSITLGPLYTAVPIKKHKKAGTIAIRL